MDGTALENRQSETSTMLKSEPYKMKNEDYKMHRPYESMGYNTFRRILFSSINTLENAQAWEHFMCHNSPSVAICNFLTRFE